MRCRSSQGHWAAQRCLTRISAVTCLPSSAPASAASRSPSRHAPRLHASGAECYQPGRYRSDFEQCSMCRRALSARPTTPWCFGTTQRLHSRPPTVARGRTSMPVGVQTGLGVSWERRNPDPRPQRADLSTTSTHRRISANQFHARPMLAVGPRTHIVLQSNRAGGGLDQDRLEINGGPHVAVCGS